MSNAIDYRDLPWVSEADGEPSDADPGEVVECRRTQVPPTAHGQRLDKLLVTMAGEFSRAHLQALIQGGHVRIDGRTVCSASHRVRSGQQVEVELMATAQSRAFHAQPMALAPVFEDEHLLVLDKPAGLVVHPAAGHWSGTLLNGILAHHRAAAALPRAGIVHRLDKDTSGLMVVGKSILAVTALVRAIAARDVHREYLAIVHGEAARDAWSVQQPIGRDPRSRVRMTVSVDGKPARTDVTRVAARHGFTALRCLLHTGRTHQIRVHLASMGLPLVGDALYGGRGALGMERQALHAARLELRHPVLGRDLVFEAPPPPDFAAAWDRVTHRAQP